MSILKNSRILKEAIGALGANYLRLVHATTRFETVPADPYAELAGELPAIVAMWHGQHFMVQFARRAGDRIACLVSRSGDGDLNEAVLRRLDVRAIRGSGARGRDPRLKGGSAALREMLRALAGGETVVMTADIPKQARTCGLGIVQLARFSGRPIVPIAVVSKRRIDFNSWDRASLGLPFGRGAMVFGAPIHVGRDSDDAALEAARLAVETSLNAIHAQAYAMVGDRDPGADLVGAAKPA